MDDGILELGPESDPLLQRAEIFISIGDFADADAVRRGAKQ